MATIKKVADLAGVSVATVSYVMNNRPDVSDDTRARVLEIARKVNYAPSKNLSRRRSSALKNVRSLAFVSCLPFDPWGEPYYGQFLSGCLNASHPDIVLQVARLDPDTPSPASLPAVVRERITDGLIVTGWPRKNLIEILETQRIPMVLVDTRDIFDGVSSVRPDHGGGTIKSVKYLYELGHRRIGVIAGDMAFDCEVERLTSYSMAMTQLGLPCREDWVVKQPHLNEQAGYDGMKELIRRNAEVTAVVCHGDMIARGAMTAARENGLHVPGDISIIGFDNQPWSDQTDPPLTTVDVSLVELGQVAVKHLMERIENPKLSPQRITIESKIVERGSTGPVKSGY